MAKSIQRKTLKEPDEFLTITRHALDYVRSHEREVSFAVLGVLAVAAAVAGARGYQGWQESQAENAFGAARRDYAAQRFETAAKGYERVATTWPSTTHGHLALVYLGNSYSELGKTKEAQDAFAKAIAKGGDPMVLQIAHYNLGLLKAKDGDKAAAGKELTAATELEGPLRGVSWFARLGNAEQFVEDVGKGMQAIDELGPDARAYVEAQIAARAKPEVAKP